MKISKILTAASLAIALVISFLPLTVSATGNTVKILPFAPQFKFDGKQVTPPTGQFAFSYQSSTYVPLRFVSYALQKNVEWDGELAKVSVNDPTPSQLVAIQERLMNSTAGKSTVVPTKQVSVAPIKVSYVFNGTVKNVPSGQLTFMYEGTLYVPIRFVAESTGAYITWDPDSKTIIGQSQVYLQNQQSQGSAKEDSQANKPGANSSAPLTPPASGGGSGANSGQVTYENITSAAQAKLESLQAESKSTLLKLAKDYVSASDEATKKKLLAEGQQKLDAFTARFESIVNDTEQQLKANGYSTDIISQYRKTFNDEIKAGKQLAEGLYK